MGKGILGRLGAGLFKTRKLISSKLQDVFRGHPKVGEELFDSLEETLIGADVGIQTAVSLVKHVREKGRSASSSDEVLAILKDEMLRTLSEVPSPLPAPDGLRVVLVIGVNGVGKTTTIGKLAHVLRGDGKKVLVAAADTFRAAAIEQLETWCGRAGVDIIRHREGADPAAIVYDAIHAAQARATDVLLVDTAGRLHTKANLMQELQKVKRVATREAPAASQEVWLILDAVTGQNGLSQAREFFTAAGTTGVILTKLDGSAKGGIAFSIAAELRIPILYVGVGEGLEDLVPFSAREYVDSMFSESERPS